MQPTDNKVLDTNLAASMASLSLSQSLPAASASSSDAAELSPFTPRTPRRRSGRNLNLLSPRQPDFSDVKMPTGGEDGKTLARDLDYYQQRKAVSVAEIQKLRSKENLSQAENDQCRELEAYVKVLDAAIEKITPMLKPSGRTARKSYKNMSLEAMKEEKEKHKARYREQGLKQRVHEVEAMSSRLSATGTEARQVELDERLEDIKKLVLGLPSREDKVPSVAIAITELWRTSGSTKINYCGNVVQEMREDSKNRFVHVDAAYNADFAKRFKTLFQLFQIQANDKAERPDVSKWLPGENLSPEEKDAFDSYKKCCEWAERSEKTFNELMRRYLRSCSQAMYTGSLTGEDIQKYAPNIRGQGNELYTTFAAGSQEIYRKFYEDGSYKVCITLPVDFKNLTTKDLFATLTIKYTIRFNELIEPVSLVSKVFKPVDATPEAIKPPAHSPAAALTPPLAPAQTPGTPEIEKKP